MLFNSATWFQRQFRAVRPQRPRRPLKYQVRYDTLETRELLSTSIPLNGLDWTALGPTTSVVNAFDNNLNGNGFGGGPGFGFTGGAGPTASEITSIVPDPSDVNHIYIGTAGGGVFSGELTVTPNPAFSKIFGGGPGGGGGGGPGNQNLGPENLVSVAWTPLTSTVNFPGTGVIGSLAIDPDHPNVLFAGTGEANYQADSYPGKGILKSTDGGKTWALLTGQLLDPLTNLPDPKNPDAFNGYSISKIVVDWTDSNTIFAEVTPSGSMGATGANCGIYRSLDGGLTWTNITASIAGSGTLAFTDMIVDPQSENLIFAIGDVSTGANGQPVGNALNGVYISTDATNPTVIQPTFVQENAAAGVLKSGVAVGRVSLASGWRGPYTTDWVSISDPSGSLLQVAEAHNGANGYPSGQPGGPALPPGTYPWFDVTPNLANGGGAGGNNNPSNNFTTGNGASPGDYMSDAYSNFVQPPYGAGLQFSAGNYTNAIAVEPTDTDIMALGGGHSYVQMGDPSGLVKGQVDIATDLLTNYYTKGGATPNDMAYAAIAEINSPTQVIQFPANQGGGFGVNFGFVPTVAKAPQPAVPFDFYRDVGDFTHAMAYDKVGDLFVASDTGLWVFNDDWLGGNGLGFDNSAVTFPPFNGVIQATEGFWSNLNGNLPNGQFNSVGLVPGNSDTVFAGARGIAVSAFGDGTSPILTQNGTETFDPTTGTFTLTPAQGPLWANDNPINTALGVFDSDNFDAAGRVLVDPRQLATPTSETISYGQDIYAVTTGPLDHGEGVFFFRSQDGGLTWKEESQGLGLSDARDPILPMVFNQPGPGGEDRLLLGTDRLYVNYSPDTLDNSWTVLNYSVPATFQAANPNAVGDITAIGAGPSNGTAAQILLPANTIYIGVGSALLVSHNDGGSWTDVTPSAANVMGGGLGATPGTEFTSIVVDQTDPNIVYAVSPDSGSSFAATGGRIWASTDGGVTWVEISGGVPSVTSASGSLPSSPLTYVNPWSLQMVPMTATIANGGAGYSAGDVLTVQGGTGSAPAQLSVTSIAAQAATIANAGRDYKVGDVLTVQGGLGSTSFVSAVKITSGGSGFAVGDVLTVAGGATLSVTSVNNGVITGVTITNPGAYTTLPTGPVTAFDNTTFNATGATFQLSFLPIAPTELTVTSIDAQGAITGISVTQAGAYSQSALNPVVVSGGNGAGATFNLTGAVTGVDVLSQGTYDTLPNSPAGVSGGTGAGAQFSLTPEILLVGTDAGVYYTINPLSTNRSWTPLGAGLPDVQVRDLQYDPLTDTLAAATYGLGVYEVKLTGGGQLPTITAPPSVTLTEDSSSFSFSNANAISVADPAVVGNSIQVTLTLGDPTATPAVPAHGTLSLGTTKGLTFINGTGSTGVTTMTFQGTVNAVGTTVTDDINAALATLQFSPTPGYSGPETLTITVDDLKHAGGILSTEEVATNRTVTNIDNGGTGYTVGDVLTVQNGQFTSPAQLTVTSTDLVVTSATLSGGGAGYKVGDLLTVVGGTFPATGQAQGTAAQLMVTGVNAATGAVTTVSVKQAGGYATVPANPVSVLDVTTPAASGAAFTLKTTTSITGVALTQPGDYTAPPPNPVSVSGGTGTGAQFTFAGMLITISPITLSTSTAAATISADQPAPNLVVDVMNNSNLAVNSNVAVTLALAKTASVVAAGSGYKVGDVLTVQGGVFATPTISTPTVLTVTGVNASGAITTLAVVQSGAYSTEPTNPVSVTGGAGAGATFTLTDEAPAGFTFTPLTVQALKGIATFTGLSLTKTGTYVFAASATNVADADTGTITVTPGVATAIAFEQPSVPSDGSASIVNGGTGYAKGDLLAVQGGIGTTNTVTTAAFGARGANYLMGDVLTVLGGTATTPAQLTVTSANGGQINAVTVSKGGVYSVLPAGPVLVTDSTTPAAAGATFTLTFVPLNPAQLMVTAVGGGGPTGPITALAVTQPGLYVTPPANPVSVSDVTTPAASGATVTLTGPVAGLPFPSAVKVDVEDQFGNVVTNSTALVTLMLPPNPPGPLAGGSVSVPALNGVATFPGLILQTSGTYTLAATDGTHNATSTAFIVAPAPDHHVTFTALPTVPVPAGKAITPPVAVTVYDVFGNVAINSTALVTIAVATGPAGFSTSSTTQAPAVNGVATFSNLILDGTGTYTFSASTNTATVLPALSGPVTVTPSAGAGLAFESQFNTIPAGTVPSFKVDLLDQFGNLATGNNPAPMVTITATGPNGAAAAPGLATGTTAVAAVNGIATFGNLSLLQPGMYTLTASAAGNASAVSNTFTVSAGPPASVAFQFPANFPATVSAGAALPSFNVNLFDALGNAASGTTAVIVQALDHNGTPSVTVNATAINGVATITGLALPTPGTYTLTAQVGTLPLATSSAIAAVLPAATALGFAAPLGNVTAGQALPTFTVNVLDQFNNPIGGASVPVALTLNGAGVPLATVNTVNGVATFTGLTLTTSGTFKLTASSAGLTSGVSSSLAVGAAAPAKLQFAPDPSKSTFPAGTLPALAVTLVDAFGNATNSTATVTVSVAGPGTLTGTTQAAAVNGVATFNTLGLATLGSYTLSAAATGLPTITSGAFTVGAGAAAALTFEPLSATITAGGTLPTFKVDVTDAFGNPVAGTQMITVGPSVGGGSTGTTSVQAVNGVATFTGIGLTRAGTYALMASATGLTAGTSAQITVTPGPATKLAFEPFTTTVAAGQALLNLKVDVEDSYGNIASNNNSQVSLSVAGPGPLSAGSTSAPVVNGVATFLFLSFTKPGNYVLTANSAGLGSINSTSLTVTAGAPARVVFLNTPAGGMAGQTMPSLQVEVFDAYGNVIMNSSTPVTLAASSGSLSGDVSEPIVNGFATFTDVAVNTAGTVTLTASVGGQAAATTAPFMVTPASNSSTPSPTSSTTTTTTSATPASIRFVTVPSTGRAGHILSPVRIQLLDASGLPVKKAHVLVKIRLSHGRLGGTLEVFTDANGIATFKNLKIASKGRYTLVVSAAGVRTALAHAITISLSVPAASSGTGRMV